MRAVHWLAPTRTAKSIQRRISGLWVTIEAERVTSGVNGGALQEQEPSTMSQTSMISAGHST
jgi:hypothetical protein